jgi:hypothetical protein
VSLNVPTRDSHRARSSGAMPPCDTRDPRDRESLRCVQWLNALAFSTSVIGVDASTGVAIRNRPSEVTAYCSPLPLVRAAEDRHEDHTDPTRSTRRRDPSPIGRECARLLVEGRVRNGNDGAVAAGRRPPMSQSPPSGSCRCPRHFAQSDTEGSGDLERAERHPGKERGAHCVATLHESSHG